MEHTLVNEGLTSVAKPHRKWRPAEDRKAELEARRRQLEKRKRQVEARIAALDPRDKIAARKRDTRANIVLGAVLRSHMALNPSFGVELAHILDHNVRRAADRQLLAGVLGMSQLATPVEMKAAPLTSSLRGKRISRLAPEITVRKPAGESNAYC